ncbi:MAG: SMI1/KNR4 family protein [Ktedonobacterales bacterium]
MLKQIRPPATIEGIQEAEQRLHCAIPDELQHLYLLADGFVEGAFLLRDTYRLLPLSEMVDATLALVGTPIIFDVLSGEVSLSNKVVRLVFAHAKADDPDVAQITLRLWPKKKPSVELWYREGGLHTFEEVVDWQESVTEWIGECLEYYGS